MTVTLCPDLTKPFAIDELLLRVSMLIENAQNRQEFLDESPEKQKSIKPPQITESKVEAPQLLPEDLDWLKTIEGIAIREIKNTRYNVDHLAKELLMSRRQLYRRVKRTTGMTPKKYLHSIYNSNDKDMPP